MKPLVHKILATASVLVLILSVTVLFSSADLKQAQAFPNGPTDIAPPPEEPEDPCWETLPNGITIATCLETPPLDPPEPTPSPSPSATPEVDDDLDPLDDDDGLGGADPDANADGDLDPLIDMESEGGGCSLGLGLGQNAGSPFTMLSALLMAAFGVFRWLRIR